MRMTADRAYKFARENLVSTEAIVSQSKDTVFVIVDEGHYVLADGGYVITMNELNKLVNHILKKDRIPSTNLPH